MTAGQGSISLSQKFALSTPPTIPTFQEVTTAGNTTTNPVYHYNLLGVIIPFPFLKLGITDNNYATGFTGGVPASMQLIHGNSDWGLVVGRATNNANSANFTFYRTRGGNDAAVYGALVTGDRIGTINFQGVATNGSTPVNAGLITSFAENIGGNKLALSYDFTTVNDAGISATRFRVNYDGNSIFTDVLTGLVVPSYPSARVAIDSTVSGFLLPRQTQVQRTAIPLPETGLQVYQTDTIEGIYVKYAAAWYRMITSKIIEVATGNGSGATVDIDLSAFYNVYSAIKIILYNVQPATNGSFLNMRVSADGINYDAGAGNYAWCFNYCNAALNIINNGNTADTVISLIGNGSGMSNTAAQRGQIEILITNLNDATQNPIITFNSAYSNNANTLSFVSGSGQRLAAQITKAVRFLFSAGNITSLNYKVFGIN